MPIPYLSAPLQYYMARQRQRYQAPNPRAVPNPYLDYEAQAAEGLPSDLEPYLGSQAVAERLRQARRDNISDTALAAGGAILSAPDLMSGLGAAASGASQSMRAQHALEREYPVEAAMARYGVMGEQEERARHRAGEGRAQGEYRMKQEQGGYDASVMRPKQEQGLDLGLEHQDLLNKTLEQAVRYGDEKLAVEIDAALQGIAASKAEVENKQKLLDPTIRNIDSDTARNVDMGAYYRSGGSGGFGGLRPLPNTAVAQDFQDAYNRAAARFADNQYTLGVPYDDNTILGAMLMDLVTMQVPMDESMRERYGAATDKVRQMLSDVRINAQSAAQKWGNDPLFIALGAYFEFQNKKKSNMAGGGNAATAP